MKKIKGVERLVLSILRRNPRARNDDFILYGGVLKELNVSFGTTVYEFLKDAKLLGFPSFETVTRCRRHIQEILPELKNKDMAKIRKDKEYEFKDYNLTGVGEDA